MYKQTSILSLSHINGCIDVSLSSTHLIDYVRVSDGRPLLLIVRKHVMTMMMIRRRRRIVVVPIVGCRWWLFHRHSLTGIGAVHDVVASLDPADVCIFP